MLIGITGKKRAGKDVCAAHLEKYYGFIHYKFASAIKTSVGSIFLWDDEWINGEFKETIDPRWGISPREAQQAIGTELFRERLPEIFPKFNKCIGNNIWVQRFKYFYEGLPKTANVVVSDIRFLNEAESIKALGGIIVRVDRKGLVSIDPHPSEMEMGRIQPNIILENNTSKMALELKIAKVYKEILNE